MHGKHLKYYRQVGKSKLRERSNLT